MDNSTGYGAIMVKNGSKKATFPGSSPESDAEENPDPSGHSFGTVNEETTVDNQEADNSNPSGGGSGTAGTDSGSVESQSDIGYTNSAVFSGVTYTTTGGDTFNTESGEMTYDDANEIPATDESPSSDLPPEGTTGQAEDVESNFVATLNDAIIDLDVIYDGIPDMIDVEEGGTSQTFFPAVINPDLIDPMLSEGMSTKRSEIVGLNEFKALFINGNTIGANATPTRRFNASMLNAITNIENLIPTPSSRLLEIQTYVRGLCTQNVRELFELFVGPNVNLRTLVNKIIQANNKYSFLDNVSYDFVNNTFDMKQVIFNLRNKDPNFAIEVSRSSRNPYVAAAISYIILNSFAQKLITLLSLKISTRDNFLNDFTSDILINAPIANANLKAAFEDRELTMTDHDNFLGGIVRTQSPNSVNVVRIIKALHAAASGFILNEGDVFNDSNGEESNMRLGTIANQFLRDTRLISHVGLMILFDPSCELTPNMKGEGVNSSISDKLDQMSDTLNSFQNIRRTLMPMLYDLKNIESLPDGKNSQYNLIKSHLHPGSSEILTNAVTNQTDDTGVLVNDDLEVDLIKYFDNNFDVNFKPGDTDLTSDAISNSKIANILYGAGSDSEDNSHTVLQIDSNGIAHEDVLNENVAFAKDSYFKMSDVRGDELQNASNDLNVACNDFIKDVVDNYGLKGLTENAGIPQAYMEGYFDSLADRIENLRNIGTTSTTRLTEAILFARAGENKRFNSRMFVATQGLDHRDEHGQVEITGGDTTIFDNFRFNIKFEVAEGGGLNLLQGLAGAALGAGAAVGGGLAFFGAGAAILVTGPAIAIALASAAIVGTLAAVFSDGSQYFPSAKDKLFTLFYNSVIPGTSLTLGDNDAGDKLDQLFPDKAYKNRRVTAEREYDSGKIKHFWNDNKDSRTKKSIGNDEFETSSLPENATDALFLRRAGNFNKIFNDIFGNSKPRANRGLVTLPLTYEREFVKSRSALESSLTESVTKDRISKKGLYSSSLGRSLILHNLTSYIFRSSTSFTLTLSKLEGNDSNDNNKTRSIKAFYNASMFSGMIDGLRGSEKNPDSYTNESDKMYKNGYDQCKLVRDSILNDISELDDKALILAASISKIGGYYTKQKDAFLGPASNNAGESVMNYLTTADQSLLRFYNKDQFKLTSILQKKLLTPSKQNFYLPSSKDITNSQLSALYKYLGNPNRKFVSSRNLSSLSKDSKMIMHIGITNGMIESLRNTQLSSLGVETLDLEQKTKAIQKLRESSIIRINIYRKNLINTNQEDPGVLVNSIMFDTSKFFIDNVNHPNFTDAHFNLTSNNVKISDFIFGHRLYHVFNDMTITGIRGTDLNLSEVPEDPDSELTPVEKSTLFKNHLDDHYLKLYSKVMLGLDVDEDIFHFSKNKSITLKNGADDTSFNSLFVVPLNAALPARNEGLSFRQERNRIESEAAKSIFFSPKKYLDRVIQPKLFDRVFSVLIDKEQENPVTFEQFYCSIVLTTKEFKPEKPQGTGTGGKKSYKASKGGGVAASKGPIRPSVQGSQGNRR